MSLARTIAGLGAAAPPPGDGTPAFSAYMDGDNTGFFYNPSSDGDWDQWTLSLWYKREVDVYGCAFAVSNDSGNYNRHEVQNGGWHRFYHADDYVLRQLYWGREEQLAWNHLVIQADLATSLWRGWENGTLSDAGDNARPRRHWVGSDERHEIGRRAPSTEVLHGWLYDVHVVPGSLVDLSAFGVDDGGTWKAVPYAGPWGTHGVNLRFEDDQNLALDSAGLQSVNIEGTPVQSVDVPPRIDA